MINKETHTAFLAMKEILTTTNSAIEIKCKMLIELSCSDDESIQIITLTYISHSHCNETAPSQSEKGPTAE